MSAVLQQSNHARNSRNCSLDQAGWDQRKHPPPLFIKQTKPTPNSLKKTQNKFRYEYLYILHAWSCPMVEKSLILVLTALRQTCASNSPNNKHFTTKFCASEGGPKLSNPPLSSSKIILPQLLSGDQTVTNVHEGWTFKATETITPFFVFVSSSIQQQCTELQDIYFYSRQWWIVKNSLGHHRKTGVTSGCNVTTRWRIQSSVLTSKVW